MDIATIKVGMRLKYWHEGTMRSYYCLVIDVLEKRVRIKLSWEKSKLVDPRKLRELRDDEI